MIPQEKQKTTRLQAVAVLKSANWTTADIALALGITERSVYSYWSEIRSRRDRIRESVREFEQQVSALA